MTAWHGAAAAVPFTVFTALALGMLRRPDALVRPRFFVEDALFYADAQQGAAPWDPYAGYLLLVPRLVGRLQAPFDPSSAALLGTLVALAVTACVAGFVASGRLRSVLPGLALRVAVGLLVVLIPQGGEPLGAPSHVQWYLGIFLVARLFAEAPGAGFATWADRVALVVSALTGPVAILLAPVYWARRVRGFWWLAVPATVQLAVVLASPRSGGGYPPALLVDILATRVVDQSILGSSVLRLIPDSRLFVAPVLLAMLAVGLRVIPRHLWASGIYALIVPLAFGLAANPDRTAIMLTPWAAQRYFVIAGFVIGAAILLAAWHRRGPVQIALVALLGGGVAVDFLLAPRPG
jgi:hypothetical protein